MKIEGAEEGFLVFKSFSADGEFWNVLGCSYPNFFVTNSGYNGPKCFEEQQSYNSSVSSRLNSAQPSKRPLPNSFEGTRGGCLNPFCRPIVPPSLSPPPSSEADSKDVLGRT